MASLRARQATGTPRRSPPARAASRARKRRRRNLIDDVTAILLISPNARKLCEFYRATLGIPLKEEEHDGMPLHYGHAFGDVQFAIHNADGWPGVASRNARSPVIAFSTSDLKTVAKHLAAHGVRVTGPTDHGFAKGVSFRDPDGNLVSVFEYGPECW